MRLHTTLFLAAAAALAQPVAHAASDAELLRCRALAETARLACYDALPLAGTLPQAQAPRPAAAAVAVAPVTPALAAPAATAAPLPTATAADFGFEQRAIQQVVPDQINSRVLGLFEGWGPRTRIKLENGQVWQVTDESQAVIDLRDAKVSVVRGSMGSFFFEVDGRRARARVKRVE